MVEPLETRLVPSTFTVNNTLDDGNSGSAVRAMGQGYSNSGPDTIVFDPSVFSTPQTITLTLALPALTNSDQTTIQGPGANLLTIDGAGEYPVFQIKAGATAVLSGLTVSHGYCANGFGGGIANYGTLTVTNCILSDNSAACGGGLSSTWALTITNSNFSGNSASYGGGIDIDSGTATLTSSTFNDNTAQNNGGGIEIESVWWPITATVTDCTFRGDSAQNGGGIDIYNVPINAFSSVMLTLSVTSSTFSGNSAQNDGGAINIDHEDATVINVTVTSSTFCGNSASTGGGISNYCELSVTNSTFSGNSASSGGGISNSCDLTVTSSTFSDNSAMIGGGISNNGTLMVTSNIFNTNSAQNGGAISSNGPLSVDTSSFSGNLASQEGGAIDNLDDSTLILTNSTLTGNTASYSDGGGISNFGSTTVKNCTFSGNSAPQRRGEYTTTAP